MKAVPSLAYAAAGVDYGKLEKFKVAAQAACLETIQALSLPGVEILTWSLGLSAIIIRVRGVLIAITIEGLGTKNRAAEHKRVLEMIGVRGDHCIAIDNFEMAANDLATVGARPMTYHFHPAVENADRLEGPSGLAIIEGTKAANLEAGSAWCNGETPVLKKVIVPGAACLSGAITGLVLEESHLINPVALEAGDSLVVFEGTGMHANGLTLFLETILPMLPHGYDTDIGDGRSVADAILTPTPYYGGIVHDCQDAGIRIHKAMNGTGGGWSKWSRGQEEFTVRVHTCPPIPLLFDFLMKAGNISVRDAYGTWNMDGGYGLFVRKSDVEQVIGIGARRGFQGWECATVEKGPKRVIMEPFGFTYDD